MNLKMKSAFLTLIMAFIAVVGAQAQCSDWMWPEDKATAEEKNVLYSDAVKSSNFQAALKPHRWLLQNAPNLNTSLYINGVKIFSGLAEAEEDPAKKKEWIDSLMMMYDMRIEYCGEKEEVLTRKAYDAYRLLIRERDELPGLLELYDEVYDVTGNDMGYYIVLPYFSIVYYNARIHKELTEEQILMYYDRVSGIIDSQLKAGKNEDKLRSYKSTIDGMLVEIIDVDCDFVKSNLGPKFEETPSDLGLAKKIFGFMLAGKCTDEPLWLEAAKVIQEQEPEYGLAKNIAIKELNKDNYEAAQEYFQMALDLTDDQTNKAEIYMSMGKMQEDKGSFSQARQMYYKALEMDPSMSEAYRAIGMLYYNSFNTCKGEKDPVKDRSVFLAAYDMFQKAGASSLMQSAKEQFPSKEDIFTFNHSRGGTINTGCWIGETTTIRARDE